MTGSAALMAPVAFDHIEARRELLRIGDWWADHAVDRTHGGFFGELDYFGTPIQQAHKGIILNSRILWFFSRLAAQFPGLGYRQEADRAFTYLMENFHDSVHGGVLWELDYRGRSCDTRKQTYAQCFCIYGLSAYYKLSANSLALDTALAYFELLERHARDRVFGGYVDTLPRQWLTLDTAQGTPKSMNTHLHVLEAYTALHEVAPSEQSAAALRNILDIFHQHIIDCDSGHLRISFDDQWRDRSEHYSPGHDVEASWLIWEAVKGLQDTALTATFQPMVELLAATSLKESRTTAGHLASQIDIRSGKVNQESVWWAQTEALNGYLNAYQLSGNELYLEACDAIWQFIQKHHLDHEWGEWHGLAGASLDRCQQHYKVGNWKAPYHNGRAMLEACRRLPTLSENTHKVGSQAR